VSPPPPFPLALLELRRRSFLAASAGFTASLMLGKRARAQATSTAPLFISIEANQAWDTTTSIDPHAHPSFSTYAQGDIRPANGVPGIPLAPFSAAQRAFMVRKLGAADVDFFQTYGSFLRVINAVDNKTVSHDIGPRNAFSGSLREGFPAIGALAAAVQGRDRPLAFLSTGGFDNTEGVVTLTRSGRQNLLRELARPNSSNGTATAATMLPGGVEALVQNEQRARDARRQALLNARRSLKKTLVNHQAMITGRASETDFLDLAAVLDESPATNDRNGLIAGAGLVLAAMRTDPAACSSAHLSFGNFDTHFDHDDPATGHSVRMRDLLEGIGHIIEEIQNNPANAALKARGVLIYVASDFGRTAYNGGEEDGARGKDHWPVTSSMVIGLGAMQAKVSGGTVIGKTTPLLSGRVQPGLRAHPWRFGGNGNLTHANDPQATGAGVFTLTPTEVNYALRAALDLDAEVPLPGSPRLTERFALPEVDPTFVAAVDAAHAAGQNPLLKDV
jgi:uncharacterized protein (DUF1501 family)